MRIHLPLHPAHFGKDAAAGGSGPFARIGGELVVIELQGELTWEGDNANGVVGVLGLDRPDKPTLHIGEHHLLHGKMSTLPKPYAVIRKAQAPSTSTTLDIGLNPHALEGDAEDEESDEEREREEAARATPNKHKKAKTDKNDDKNKNKNDDEEEEEDDGPLFPPSEMLMMTPQTKNAGLPPSSSPFSEFATPARDYSSDLSSPVTGMDAWGFPRKRGADNDENEEDNDDDDRGPETQARDRERERRRAERRQKRKAEQPERARHYEVVGVVRKKVVFALRPEPLVQATKLPE